MSYRVTSLWRQVLMTREPRAGLALRAIAGGSAVER
jgi:hypothetical protein